MEKMEKMALKAGRLASIQDPSDLGAGIESAMVFIESLKMDDGQLESLAQRLYGLSTPVTRELADMLWEGIDARYRESFTTSPLVFLEAS